MKLNRLGLLLLALLLVAAISLTFVACNEDTPPEPQAGVYYYDAGLDEYSIVLGEGMQFTLNIAGSTMAGNYSLNDGALTLTSNKQGESPISATLKDNVITLTFNGAEFRFLKKVNFTVTFNSNGGSAVNSATVVNGKKVAQPADPSKNGFVFVGWYLDSAFSAPFSFNTVITKDTTVYARWVEKQIGSLEFAVSFDADNGGANPEAQATTGGKLFNLPVVEKAGHTFKGWWVSMNNDGTLSYEFTEGMSLDADTTLHAVWQSNNLGTKLADPLVSVDAKSVKWNNVGAREYLLQIKDFDGNVIVDKPLGGTVESVNFASLPAGDYTVTVTAVAASGEQNNAVSTRVYKNKAISRVSKFSIIDPATLLFNAVDNAEKYLIKVSCGDENHNHNKEGVLLDNGTSTHFCFADCLMGSKGIKFTVIAVANGFATSSSKEFTYAPTLDAITEFKFDEQTQTLTWTPVANATGYMVSVKCGNGAFSEQFVNIGSANSICLKECSNVQGGIVVQVYPVSKMFVSPSAASYTFDKKVLATPQNIRIKGTTVSWDAVDGATSYDVSIAGVSVNTTTNSVDLSGKVTLTEGQSYSLTVVAKGQTTSAPTNPVDARNLAMANAVKYQNGKLSWSHVIGAVKYDVQVNDDPVITVSNGANFADIELSQAGENTLKVRFTDENGIDFEWVSVKVFAHTVTLVSDGGSSLGEQFKAVGDPIELPKPQKEGYEFLAWYNTPKGPESNGAAFTDATFKASGDLMLYACYSSKKYTVTYHYGSGGNGVATTGDAFYQQHFNWAVPQLNDATSAFGGWFSAANGNGVQYTDEKGNSLNPWTKTEGADVYAFWLDDVLSFTLTNNAGRQIYAVLQGSRISQVSEVTIPETYKGIKVGMLSGNAFMNCSNLVTLNIPNTIELISDVDPFTGCTNLTAINVYEVEGNTSIRYWSADGVLFDNGRLDQQPSNPSQIKSSIAYMPLGKKGSYTIPNGITDIPSLAFANSQLTRVVIPASVATIGMEAFKDCKNLSAVVFASGSTALTIGDSAFSGCTALESVTLPARLTSIELTKYKLLGTSGTPSAQEVNLSAGVTDAFVGCTNLKNVDIAKDNKVYSSKNGIIYNANSTQILYALPSLRGELVIPDGVTSIANGAFIGCRYLERVTIPYTIQSVGECAFYKTDIKSVTFKSLIGNVDATIGKYAFRGCDDLATVTFEEGSRIAHIGEGAFFGCDELEEISLPANLKSVGSQAFRDCESLEELDMSATQHEVTFGSNVFYDCVSLETVRMPKNVSDIAGIFNGCSSLKQIVIDEDNENFVTKDGVLFDKNVTTLLFYPQSKNDQAYVIPETVTTIADGVFRGNGWLENVTIGKNVTKIGADAFREVDYLKTVIFTDGGTEDLEIGAYAFADMSSLKTIELPARTKNVGECAFGSTSDWSATSIKTVVLNEGLEEISDKMFYNARYLSAISIPSTVTRIGKEAFFDCGYNDDIFHLTFAADSQLETIDDGAFYDCARFADEDDRLTVELPQGLKHIGKQAFYYVGFVSITIPNTVVTIGMEAFATSSKLSAVIFEEGGTDDLIFEEELVVSYNGSSYKNSAFYNTGLTSVELPERLTFLGAEAFYNCGSLTSVTFGENSRLKYIGASAFAYTAIETITIPNTVANGTYVIDKNGTQEFRIGIGAEAFYGVSALTEINFAIGGTQPLSLGNKALYGCDELTTLNLPARLADYTADGKVVKGISVFTFMYTFSDGSGDGQSSSSKLAEINVEQGGASYCSQDGILYSADKKTLVLCPVAKTEKVTIPESVTLIDEYAFASCKLSEVEFTEGDESMVIGVRAFYSCNNITTIVLSDNVAELKNESFSSCGSLVTFTLSASMETYNANAFSRTNAQIKVSPNSSGFYEEDGVVFNKAQTKLISYPATAAAETYTIPATVTEIAANAFENNAYLKSVVFPSGLVTIGEYAFNNCSGLTNVTIPNTVETIGEYAFSRCTSLGEFKFEKGGTAQLVISKYAFQSSGVTKIQLPARLASLGSYSFYSASALSDLTFEQNSKLALIDESAFENCTSLQNVDLPQGLSVIGSKVFARCAQLEKVTFAEGLTKIGDSTFTKCPSLETVEFPASLSKMGINTFADTGSDSAIHCTALKFVTFAQGSQLTVLPEGTFANCTALESFIIPASVKTVESVLWDDDYRQPVSEHRGVFEGCTNLKSVTFEEGSKCTFIGINAFYKCSSMVTFQIPSSVSTLGRGVFDSCSSLVEMVIPSTATIYGPYMFNNCISLSRVTLGDKVTALPDGMFYNCESLKQLTIPASVTSFGNSLFSNTGFESFVIPASITEIPAYFLSNCSSLTSVTLHDGITAIGDGAFQACVLLASIELPGNLKTIGESAFQRCTALREIVIPSQVKIIGYNAFEQCSSLVQITLSENLETIDRYAFKQCISLISITIPAKVSFIDYGAFYNCYKLVEVINLSSLKIDENHNSYIGAYADAILTSANESIVKTDNNGVIYAEVEGKTGIKVIGYIGTATQVTLPADTTAIADYAFANSNIESITLPSGITVIPSYAFQNCANLVTVNVQGNLTSIGEKAFEKCVKLSNINLPDSIESIGTSAFSHCESLSNVTMPASLTTLNSYAFEYTAITNVVIPQSVTKLNAGIFGFCKSLRTVTLHTAISSISDGSSFSFVDCISLERYIMDGVGSDYKVVDGVLYNAAGTALLSVPCARKGTFVVAKEIVTIKPMAFSGSQLDLLKFEARGSSKIWMSYSDYWLGNATVKAIVISTETFSYIKYGAFSSWTKDQTVYVVQSQADFTLSLGTVGATVVYNYDESQA